MKSSIATPLTIEDTPQTHQDKTIFRGFREAYKVTPLPYEIFIFIAYLMRRNTSAL